MWLYRGVTVDSMPEDVRYFVYVISYTDGTKYVGQKVVRSETRRPPLVGMRANAKRLVLTESNWKKYDGSSSFNDGKVILSKEILHLCTNKRTATYLECRELFARGAIENEEYNNQNILGKFFSNCLDGLRDDS